MFSRILPDGTKEEVKREDWRWVVEYEDGSELHQFDEAAHTFHTFEEIEEKRVVRFGMVHDVFPPIILEFDPDSMRLIHFYRKATLEYGTKNETHLTGYVFGYRKFLEGRNHHFLVMITPENKIVLTTNKNVNYLE